MLMKITPKLTFNKRWTKNWFGKSSGYALHKQRTHTHILVTGQLPLNLIVGCLNLNATLSGYLSNVHHYGKNGITTPNGFFTWLRSGIEFSRRVIKQNTRKKWNSCAIPIIMLVCVFVCVCIELIWGCKSFRDMTCLSLRAKKFLFSFVSNLIDG